MRVVRTHVPGLVVLAHHLRHLSVRTADQVMRADLGARVLEPRDRAGVAALHGVDGDFAHRRAAARGVVGRRHPARAGEIHGRQALDVARGGDPVAGGPAGNRTEGQTYEIQSLMRISYDGLCLKKRIETTDTEV